MSQQSLPGPQAPPQQPPLPRLPAGATSGAVGQVQLARPTAGAVSGAAGPGQPLVPMPRPAPSAGTIAAMLSSPLPTPRQQPPRPPGPDPRLVTPAPTPPPAAAAASTAVTARPAAASTALPGRQTGQAARQPSARATTGSAAVGGSSAARTSVPGGEQQQPEAGSSSDAGPPYSFPITMFAKQTSRQQNNDQSRVHQNTDFTVPNAAAVADMLWQIVCQLNANQKPQPWAHITRSPSSPTSFEARNPTPNLEDSSHAVHYFVLYAKNPSNFTSTGATIYRLPGMCVSAPAHCFHQLIVLLCHPGEAIPAANGSVHPPITDEILANWHNRADGVVVVYFTMGRYFNSVEEVQAYRAILQPASTQESRTGGAAVPLAIQLAERARAKWSPYFETEDMHWEATGAYLATLPDITREAYLADGPPPMLQFMLRPQPTVSEMQLDCMRRGMTYAHDCIAAMESWKVRLASLVDALDQDIAHLRAGAASVQVMIRPIETPLARTFADSVSDMLDFNHMQPPAANGE